MDLPHTYFWYPRDYLQYVLKSIYKSLGTFLEFTCTYILSSMKHNILITRLTGWSSLLKLVKKQPLCFHQLWILMSEWFFRQYFRFPFSMLKHCKKEINQVSIVKSICFVNNYWLEKIIFRLLQFWKETSKRHNQPLSLWYSRWGYFSIILQGWLRCQPKRTLRPWYLFHIHQADIRKICSIIFQVTIFV